MFDSIKLCNFLSFGNSSDAIPLGPLNVLVGANGSGKSNLIEAFSLLESAPTDFRKTINEGGGIRDWLWKGGTFSSPSAELDVVLENVVPVDRLRYVIKFREVSQKFQIDDERLEFAQAKNGEVRPYFFYHFENGKGILNVKGNKRALKQESIDVDLSILAQRKDPDQYPELTQVGMDFSKIQIYREWTFGRYTPPRMPQKADLPNEYLRPQCDNLGLVLNKLCGNPQTKKIILGHLRALYDGIDDISFQIEGGTVQIFLAEGSASIPATRLSDGTLRYLCLLAILCNPKPPPLICIEEPELGLHPDIMPRIAELLITASQRTQLIVTTHSAGIIDALSDQPESVLVAERTSGSTHVTRLESAPLKTWLEKYRLGELWTRGDIGGTRW